jgi:hypothetical protein
VYGRYRHLSGKRRLLRLLGNRKSTSSCHWTSHWRNVIHLFISDVPLLISFVASPKVWDGGLYFGSCASPLHLRSLSRTCTYIRHVQRIAGLTMDRALPETLRAIVGDGSIPPPRIYNTPLSLIKPQWATSAEKRPAPKPIQNPFRLFAYPDVVVLLTFNGIFYAVFYGVTATISSLFAKHYPSLSETDLGLVFLSVGGGMVFGSGVTGKLLDRDYRLIKAKLDAQKHEDAEKHEPPKEQDFPIELARLRSTPIYLLIYVTAIVGYGWSLQSRTSIAVPLVLHFISMFYCLLPVRC